jgi:hypothetical protein
MAQEVGPFGVSHPTPSLVAGLVLHRQKVTNSSQSTSLEMTLRSMSCSIGSFSLRGMRFSAMVSYLIVKDFVSVVICMLRCI